MTRIILGVLAAVLLAPQAARAQAEEVVYYHTDAIGSVRAITDATGDVIARYDFLPFGESWLPPSSPDPRQFAGKERDAESGLDYFGARYHKAGIGRFTTVDPVMNIDAAAVDPQRWNRYAYAKNNPFVFVDPDGREIWLSSAHQRALAAAGQRAAPAAAIGAGVAAIAGLVEAGPVAWRAAYSCFLSAPCQSAAAAALEGMAGAPGGSTGAIGSGRTIGLGLDATLEGLGEAGAVTYLRQGWQKAGLTNVVYEMAMVDKTKFFSSFVDATRNATSIRFDVTGLNLAYSGPSVTLQELRYIISSPALLSKTTFIRDGREVVWNGVDFIYR